MRTPAATIAAPGRIGRAMGSRAAFEAASGTMLLDRGTELDDREGMERSCPEPGERRCSAFWCDPQESSQKSEAERNHEQPRRIFPKGHVDMDALADADVALACSHVSSYPPASIGGCPFGELGSLLPEGGARKARDRAHPCGARGAQARARPACISEAAWPHALPAASGCRQRAR